MYRGIALSRTQATESSLMYRGIVLSRTQATEPSLMYRGTVLSATYRRLQSRSWPFSPQDTHHLSQFTSCDGRFSLNHFNQYWLLYVPYDFYIHKLRISTTKSADEFAVTRKVSCEAEANYEHVLGSGGTAPAFLTSVLVSLLSAN
jgi:hypothetical protein